MPDTSENNSNGANENENIAADIEKKLKKLNKDYAVKKGLITRFTNDFNRKVNPTIKEVERFINTIHRYETDVLEIQEEIRGNHVDLEDLDEYETTEMVVSFETYIEQVDKIIDNAQENLNNLTKQQNDQMNQSFCQMVKDSTESDDEMKTKLPPLKVPTFYGDKLKYRGFIEKFDSLIGSKTNMKPNVKFSYLLMYVEGEALLKIESLPVTDASYTTARFILDKNYDKTEEILYELSLKLINLKMQKANFNNLSVFYSELECIRMLARTD